MLVRYDIEDFPKFLWIPLLSSSKRNGLLSEIILPSFNSTILVEYSFASFGLWVTIITSLSLATSLSNSITWTLVSESRAPVGSSASTMLGLFTSALAIATLCICPPDNWLGFLCIWSFNPTLSKTSIALFSLSALDIPEIVKANSTLAKIVWWEIKL